MLKTRTATRHRWRFRLWTFVRLPASYAAALISPLGERGIACPLAGRDAPNFFFALSQAGYNCEIL